MSLYFTQYYTAKNLLDKISSNHVNKSICTNSLIFKYSIFFNSYEFYELFNPFRRDKYRIKEKFNNDDVKVLIKDCIINSLNSTDENRLFCYILLISYHVNINYKHYLPDSFKLCYKEKMIDSYIYNKNEKMSISKLNLGDYFFNSFDITDDEINYINSVLKQRFGFFKADNYYKNCYKNMKKFYSKYTGSSMVKIKAFLYDILLNHKKGKIKISNLVFDNKIDTNILNNKKTEYNYKDKIIKFNLDEFFLNNIKEISIYIDCLNNYYSTENEKHLNNIF